MSCFRLIKVYSLNLKVKDGKYYEDSKLPLYALIEVFSFGTLSKFYKNMISSDKKEIEKLFGVM